jgi:hypothetical protein
MEDSALDAELVTLVEDSVAQLAPPVQQMCGMHDICEALQSLGCTRVSDLQLLLSGDLLIVQAALAPTPIMFLMMLKRLALASAASPSSAAAAAASPAPRQSPAFQTPTNNTEGQCRCLNRPRTFLSRPWGVCGQVLAHFLVCSARVPIAVRRSESHIPCLAITLFELVLACAGSPGNATPASAQPSSVVASVKLGPKPIVESVITAVTATTTYAELLNITIAEQSSAQRAKLASLPVKVAAYTGPQHLSTQKAEAQLSATVASSVALGYRHVVFSYTPPSQQPAPRPSASAFEHLMGTGLPDRETGADEAELSFDKALYNWLIDMCEVEKLGVRRDETQECAKFLKAVRDALQVIDGREGSFQYSRVPESFKAYKVGERAVKRAKKPEPRWAR